MKTRSLSRAELKRKSRQRKFISLGILLLIVLTSTLWSKPVAKLIADNLVVSSNHFKIEQVRVSGNRVLNSDSLLKIANIPLRIPIFNISTKSIETKLKKNPWIDEVWIERDLPSTVNILVKERVPVAILNSVPQSLLSAEGIALNLPASESYMYLPTLTPLQAPQVKFGEPIKDPSTLALLNQLNTANRVSDNLRHNLSSFYYHEKDIYAVLLSPASEINVGKGINELAWSSLQARIAIQKKNNPVAAAEIIDLRIPGKIIVKPANTQSEEYING